MSDDVGTWAVLTAAGSGTRLGAPVPKALVPVGDITLLELAVSRLVGAQGMRGIVVTCPPGMEEQFLAAATAGGVSPDLVRVVAGGVSRQSSVKAGLDALKTWMEEGVPSRGPLAASDVDEQIVLIHDAARCLAPVGLMNKLVEALRPTTSGGGSGSSSDEAASPSFPAGVIPGLPVTDTIKQVRETGAGDVVVATPPRSALRAVQTPQAFRMGPLFAAHEKHLHLGADEESAATDDAALLELAGDPVVVIEGDPLAFKVTIPPDLEATRKHLAEGA